MKHAQANFTVKADQMTCVVGVECDSIFQRYANTKCKRREGGRFSNPLKRQDAGRVMPSRNI